MIFVWNVCGWFCCVYWLGGGFLEVFLRGEMCEKINCVFVKECGFCRVGVGW